MHTNFTRLLILAGGTLLLSLDDIQTITILKHKGIKDDNVMR